jgi:hypothetical protein
MNQFNRMAAALAAAALLSVAPAAAFAQTSQPATPPPAKSSTPAPASSAPASSDTSSKPRSAVSIECSKEADAKGLHGKARKEFRSECRKNAMGKPG